MHTPHHELTEYDILHPYLQLVGQGTPVVLRNTPFDKWASAFWTPEILAKELNIVQVLSKKGTNNVFRYFANDQPLSQVNKFVVSKPFIEVIYPRERFFSLLNQRFNGHYYYSSGGVELLGIETLYSRKEIEPLTFWTTSKQELGQVNFWFGMENVTAYTHYDTSHNLHSISYGKKRFVLFPPEAYLELKLYPCLHQFYRQTYMSVSDVLTADTIQKLNGIDITLYPGEVLYIPSYWFHCVITMETTLSVNVWSQSEAYNTMENIYSLPLPFEESWGKETLMKTLDYFWKKLATVLFHTEYKTLMKQVALERYKPLLKLFTKKEKLDLFSEVISYCRYANVHLSGVVSQESFQHIDQRIDTLKNLFLAIPEQSIREINFGNYVEHTAFRILSSGDVLLLPFYFQHCYN